MVTTTPRANQHGEKHKKESSYAAETKKELGHGIVHLMEAKKKEQGEPSGLPPRN